MDDDTPESSRPRKRWRGQCSASSAAMHDYDVFINHRGPDVKVGFVAHLHDAFTSVGLNSFLDKKSMVQGDHASESINDALRVAKVHVAVVSSGYADSKHCLSELAAMVDSGKPVIPVFYDVEPAELRRVESGRFATAIEKHRSREESKLVEKWIGALGKLADITGFCFRLSDYQGDEAELKWKVVHVVHNLISTNRTLHIEHHIIGIKKQVDICINTFKMSSDTSFLCLVGMGGIGKTTLAKNIYNYLVGFRKFGGASLLEIDRHSSSSSILEKFQKKLLWDLLRIPYINQQHYEYCMEKLSNQGPVLIVFDDVYDKSLFDKLILDTSLLASGSCIILTSRDRHLLRSIVGTTNSYFYSVRTLELHESQKVFNLHAFHNEEAPENFKALAQLISQACGGLPLALKVVGCSLFDKKSNEDRKNIWLEAIDALKKNSDVTSALRWSYNCLSEEEKLMFVDIACVFHGWNRKDALEIWKSCKECSSFCNFGTPYTSLTNLIDKSLVTLLDDDGDVILKMHNLLQDVGQTIGKVDGSHLERNRDIEAIQDEKQVLKKIRALNLSKDSKHTFQAEDFIKMPNLHFLILDGCNVEGDFGNISKQLRCLQWKDMPMMHLPSIWNLSNLVSLDFSGSTQLANMWTNSKTTFEGFPNLLRLDLNDCSSLTMLPDSIARLSKLQVLKLTWCKKLQHLPPLEQLTALEQLFLQGCRSLEVVPDSITSLSQLLYLTLDYCSSITKLPKLGLLTSLDTIVIDVAFEWQVHAIAQLKELRALAISSGSTDNGITLLDSSSSFNDMQQLWRLQFIDCVSMSKLPETIGLLTNLEELSLSHCPKVQRLPQTIEHLKRLKELWLMRCNNLTTIPDCVGALPHLEDLLIIKCILFTTLPTSIGYSSSLRTLRIEDCKELEPLPESLRQLTALEMLTILDCGSLKHLGVLRMLENLPVWGCTSITTLPGSHLIVADSNLYSADEFRGFPNLWSRRILKELHVIEANDCGMLRIVQDTTGELMLQRLHNLPCDKVTLEKKRCLSNHEILSSTYFLEEIV